MSLRTRLLLLYGTLLMVMVLVLGVAVTWRWRNAAEAALVRQAQSQCKSAASMTVLALQVADREELRRIADGLLVDKDIRYCLFQDAPGNTVAAYGDISVVPHRPEGAPAGNRDGQGTLRFDGLIDVRAPVVDTRPQSNEGLLFDTEGPTQTVGWVRLGFSTSRLGTAISAMVIWMVAVAAALLLAGTLIGMWGISRFLHPVKTLMEATREVASGRFDMRVEVSGGSELAALAQSFNTMTDSLDTLLQDVQQKGKALEVANEEIGRANAELEGRVAERTAELDRANERLRREMADKNDFLRVVSHDLGAPLRNIIGMVDSITRRHGDGLDGQVKGRLDRVRRNAEAEMGLIEELLELSRIRTRKQNLVEVDVGEVVREVADSLAEDLGKKKTRFVAAESWPTIYCERARVAQVFQNYIDNAVKYMLKQGDSLVEAGWREERDRYVFFVRDNGAGIAPEDKASLFHVFRRGRSAASQAEGKGVGLAAVKAVAETYEGEAWVESELGRGSTFFFSLAKARVKPTPETADPAHSGTD